MSGLDSVRRGASHTGNASDETAIGVSNVSGLQPVYSFPLSTTRGYLYSVGMVTSNGKLFAAGTNNLIAVDLAGSTNCAGTPKVCQPLWSANLPAGTQNPSQPVVANGVVYQTSEGANGSQKGELLAYDANGVTNCSGTPVVCQPLWTASVQAASPPVVDNGVLFVSDFQFSATELKAFDANGVTNCSGTPVVCQPLWTASILSGTVPAVANGKVYLAGRVSGIVNGNPFIGVYDEAGTTGCAGTPTVCQPLYTVTLPDNPVGSVDVTDGTGYISNGTELVAFDATGTANCAGSPLVCQPLWTATTGDNYPSSSTPAVANGRVYAYNDQTGTLFAFDRGRFGGMLRHPKDLPT